MSWAGKVIGGTLGLAVGGPIGAVIGGIIGNQFDKNSSGRQQRLNKQEESQMVFFTTTFSMLAKFAQADGSVTRSEIDVIDNFARNELELDQQSKKLAIEIFDEAKRKQASFEDYARQFYSYFKNEQTLLISMLDLLMRIAVADNDFHEKEEEYLEKTRQIFNISSGQFESIKARYVDLESGSTSMEKYYKILESSPDDSLQEIKKQYRKKAKEYHPDNVMGKGLPEEFVDFAEKKFKKIQEAYEKVKQDKKAS